MFQQLKMLCGANLMNLSLPSNKEIFYSNVFLLVYQLFLSINRIKCGKNKNYPFFIIEYVANIYVILGFHLFNYALCCIIYHIYYFITHDFIMIN